MDGSMMMAYEAFKASLAGCFGKQRPADNVFQEWAMAGDGAATPMPVTRSLWRHGPPLWLMPPPRPEKTFVWRASSVDGGKTWSLWHAVDLENASLSGTNFK